MDTTPPGKSAGREIAESTGEAVLASVPLVGGALAVVFKTAVGWRVERRREEFLAGLAEELNEVHGRVDDLNFEKLADNPVFVDAVMTAARAVEHTSQADKIAALRNAVLNSVAPDAPDSDAQAIMMAWIDRFTATHLRLLALWDDPPAWFVAHGLTPPAAAFITSRTVTVEAGLPEMKGRQDFYLLVAGELESAGMLTAKLSGNVQPPSLMSRLTTDFGRQFVRFISPPE